MTPDYLDSELLPVYTEVLAATRPDDVFGVHDHLSEQQRRTRLDTRMQELRRVLDPDRYSNLADSSAASDARDVLERLYREACGMHSEPDTLAFTIGRARYEPIAQIATGEHSIIYRALATTNDSETTVALKIGHGEEATRVLAHEAELLRFFHSAHDRHPIVRVRRTLPELLDMRTIDDRTVSVLPYYAEHKTVQELLLHFKHHLPVGHAAWIARRALAFPITAHLANLTLNGAVRTEHLLVHPLKHEPIYLGWAHASPLTQEGEHRDTRDALTLVRTLFSDLSGTPHDDVPDALINYIEGCFEHTEHHSLSQIFTEFTELVYRHLGKQYRPLHLNN